MTLHPEDVPHACGNCEGIDPESCFNAPGISSGTETPATGREARRAEFLAHAASLPANAPQAVAAAIERAMEDEGFRLGIAAAIWDRGDRPRDAERHPDQH